MRTHALGLSLVVSSIIFAGCGDDGPVGEACVVPSALPSCELPPADDLARPTANPPLLPSECTELGDECLLPYPNSAFLREDESTPSGRRVAPPARLEGIGVDLDEVARADGFSRVSPLVTRLPGGVSAGGLPSPRDRVAAYAASTADDAPIFVVLADPTSPRYGERVPYFAEAFASTEDPDEALLVITPLEVLEPAARYAVVVTSRVRDRCGQPSAPNAAMRALLANERPAGELGARWDAFRDLRFLAEVELGLSPCDIVEAWDFWTRSDEDLTRDLLAMRGRVYEWLDENPPTPEVISIETVPADGSIQIEFAYASPIFRIDPESGFLRDDDGLPEIVREEIFVATLLLPAGASDEAPVVPLTMGHGFGMDRTQLCALARPFVMTREKFALACFDWDLHGQRGAGADAILGLLAPRTLPALASVFLQSAVDELVFSESLRALAADPALEERLDVSRHLYAGVSMGGVVGALVTAIDEMVDASVLNVPGAGIVHIVRQSSLFDSLGVRRIVREVVESLGSVTSLPGDLEAELIIAMSQFALDEADPANWGSHIVHDRLVAGAPPVLVQESMGDGVVPNFTTELLARSIGLPLVSPYRDEVPGLQVVEAPTGPHGLTQFSVAPGGPLAHLLIAFTGVQDQLFYFLDSILDEDPANDGDIRFE